MFLAQSYAVPAEANTDVIIGVLIAAAIALPLSIFFCLTLQGALKSCAPENRTMAPGLVWLLFIPVFAIVWQFFVVINVAKSLGIEFQKRGIAEDLRPGKTIGLVACILGCCGIIPHIGGFISLGAGICWIIYWVKIAVYSGKLP